MDKEDIKLQENTFMPKKQMDEIFNNIQIDLESLPKHEDLQFTKLEKNYIVVRLIGVSIILIILSLLYIVALNVLGDEFPKILRTILSFLLSVIVFASLLFTYFGVKRKSYSLRERDIVYQSGLLWRSSTTIPFSRIQHSEVTQGPIERWFDLASLHIYTAGGSASDIDIPGLNPDRAQRIKSFVLQKIKSEEEE